MSFLERQLRRTNIRHHLSVILYPSSFLLPSSFLSLPNRGDLPIHYPTVSKCMDDRESCFTLVPRHHERHVGLCISDLLNCAKGDYIEVTRRVRRQTGGPGYVGFGHIGGSSVDRVDKVSSYVGSAFLASPLSHPNIFGCA